MRWLRALIAFVGVFFVGLFLAALIGFGFGQYELLLLLALASGAAGVAYRPGRGLPRRRSSRRALSG
jgi:hypothetical protein